MAHVLIHFLIRIVVYPVFYWIGVAVLKAVTFGNAIVMAYSELDEDHGAAWWEFRVQRWGFKYWRPESLIVIGGGAVLVVVTSYYTLRYLV